MTVSEDVDGMAWVSALIDAVDAHRIDNRLSAAAAAAAAAHADGTGRRAGCTRTSTAPDVFVATPGPHRGQPTTPPTLTGGAADGRGRQTPDGGPGFPAAAPDPGRCPVGPVAVAARPDIHVVIDAATLLGLAQTPPTSQDSDPSRRPGPRPGRRGRWRLLLTDAAGGLVTAVSSRTYAPSAAVARLVRAREATCRWPGCTRHRRPATSTTPSPTPDGATTPANLGPLCRRHHNLKTHHGYILTNLPHPTTANENSGTTTTACPDPEHSLALDHPRRPHPHPPPPPPLDP